MAKKKTFTTPVVRWPLTERVVNLLMASPGKFMTVKEIAEALQYKNADSVRVACNRVFNAARIDCIVEERGRTYAYAAPPSVSAKIDAAPHSPAYLVTTDIDSVRGKQVEGSYMRLDDALAVVAHCAADGDVPSLWERRETRLVAELVK
jgi:hypothetical protein